MAVLIALVAAMAIAPAAHAAFGLQSFDSFVIEADGSASTQAGGHPRSATAGFSLNTFVDPVIGEAPYGPPIRHARVALPVGFVGNPSVAAQCPEHLLVDKGRPDVGFLTGCPVDSQVGTVAVRLNLLLPQERVPLFRMESAPGVPAVFGFYIGDVGIHLRPRLRTGDYGLSMDSVNINHTVSLLSAAVTVWGTPADPVHDVDRKCPDHQSYGCSSDLARRPFLTNPTTCVPAGDSRLDTSIEIESWGASPLFDGASVGWHEPGDPGAEVGLEGCERLPFDPSLDVRVDSSEPDAPTGMDVELEFPQHGMEHKDGLATAHLKDATVVLPEGMSISPSAAHGLKACTDAQLDVQSNDPVACPEASRLGSVEATTPLLDEALTGAVYAGQQRSFDPESGEMFRIFMVVEHELRGIRVKLRGQVRANPETGRLETTFEDNPQMPVSKLKVRLKGGSRAPLATPPTCGTKTVSANLSSWAGHGRTLTDTFTIDCPGASGFAPLFAAGAISPVGGSFSPFTAQIDRPDRQQYLAGVKVDMPNGLLAKLAGVELCPDAVAGDGTPGLCPAGSRVGTATVGAGPGSLPFFLQGPVYLTGPYKGAPYGLSVQVAAKAGPFDLGVVKVRNALQVDPETAQASVVSDRLPQIVKGVPVRLRSVDVDIDRPDFTINPTSCAEKQIDATLTSAQGAVSKTTRRFQVGDCQALGFKPRLGMRLVGRKQMKSGGHPILRATLKQGGGQANIRSAKVTLPPNVVLDSKNSVDPKLLCGYDASLRADCPASSIIGKATLRTPLLNKPLAGPVHFVQGIRFSKTGNRIRTLPTLLVKLRGEVAINLRSQTNTDSKDRLVSVFPSVPDARAGRFDIQINGGPKGILVVTENRRGRISLCNRKQTALVETDGHNGKRADYPIRVKTPCANAKAKKGASRRR